jgi:hypothetical protein
VVLRQRPGPGLERPVFPGEVTAGNGFPEVHFPPFFNLSIRDETLEDVYFVLVGTRAEGENR